MKKLYSILFSLLLSVTAKAQFNFGYDFYYDCGENQRLYCLAGDSTIMLVRPSEYDNEDFRDDDAYDIVGDLVIPEVITHDGVDYTVTNAWGNIFGGCVSMTSITLPATLIDLGFYPFVDCPSLRSITVADDNPAYVSVDGVLFDKYMEELICYPAQKECSTYDIPETVEFINSYSFSHTANLTTVNIPNSVEYIDFCAFKYSSIESIALPDNMAELGEKAFYHCANLSDVKLNYILYKIEDSAFEGCTSLENIVFHGYLHYIGAYAFKDCTSLDSLIFNCYDKPSTFHSFDNIAEDAVMIVPCGQLEDYHNTYIEYFNEENMFEDCTDYTITVDEGITGGTITASTYQCHVTTIVTLEEHHDNDYRLVGYSAYKTDDPSVIVTVDYDEGNFGGTFFVMPNYDVTVTAEFVYAPDGLEENNTTVSIAPNPTTGMIQFDYANNDSGIQQVEIRNMLGATVLETADMKGNTIDVSSLPTGVYIMSIVTKDGKEFISKLVKK